MTKNQMGDAKVVAFWSLSLCVCICIIAALGQCAANLRDASYQKPEITVVGISHYMTQDDEIWYVDWMYGMEHYTSPNLKSEEAVARFVRYLEAQATIKWMTAAEPSGGEE